ncbi:hypothetical protein RvY_03686 [Ramazzottius varieornatus]|uniref:Uncharacterized protein n=1 Tax=Ramazzottius varieornatus TaxID=947166 RepID=A0A1D1USL9_RAMVA|nr:hypothetical protein RvY_03686 [Ramazzottius varieornatus]
MPRPILMRRWRSDIVSVGSANKFGTPNTVGIPTRSTELQTAKPQTLPVVIPQAVNVPVGNPTLVRVPAASAVNHPKTYYHAHRDKTRAANYIRATQKFVTWRDQQKKQTQLTREQEDNERNFVKSKSWRTSEQEKTEMTHIGMLRKTVVVFSIVSKRT